MSETTDRAKLIKEAEGMSRYVQRGGPDDGTVYDRLAVALTQSERELTELGTAFRDYKIVHPEGTEDLHRKLAEQTAAIEAALKVTDDMRSGGWHIGKTVPDLGEKLYRILDTTEGTR